MKIYLLCKLLWVIQNNNGVSHLLLKNIGLKKVKNGENYSLTSTDMQKQFSPPFGNVAFYEVI
jgi:hypothetical protein